MSTLDQPVRPEPVRADRRSAGTRTTSVLYVSGRLGAQILEFVLWVVAAQRLDLATVGVLAIALLGSRYAGFVGDWGATFTGPREVARFGVESDEVSSLLVRRTTATIVASLAYLIAVVLSGHSDMWPLVAVVLFRGLNRDWIGLGSGRPLRAVAGNVAGNTLALGLGIALPVEWIPAAFGFGGLVAVAISLSLHRVGRRPDPKGVRRARAAGWYVVAGLAGLTYTTVDTFLLGLLRSNTEVAIYASVYRLPNAWLLLIGLAVGAAVPRVAEHLERLPHARQQLRSRAMWTGLVGAGVVVAATPVASWLAPALFGDDFVSGRSPLVILMFATAIVTFGAPSQVLVIADGDDRRAALVMAVSAAINVAANLVVIPAHGMVGAAWTTVVTQAIPAAFYVATSRRNPA